MNGHSLRRLTTSAALLLALGGCAATTLEEFPSTAELVDRGDLMSRGPSLAPSPYQAAVDAHTDDLLEAPLTLNAALQIAMLNAPALRAVYQDQQVRSPRFVDRLAAAAASGTDEPSVEWTALRLALLPAANRELSYDLAELYAAAVPAFVETAKATRKAWYTAVAAEQTDALLRQAVDALRAEAELANEQYRAGTASRGEQAKRHMALGGALKEQAAAQRDLVRTREALIRTLGLWGSGTDLKLPDRLPELPPRPATLDDVESFALQNRMDVVASRREGGARELGTHARSEARQARFAYLSTYETAKYQRDTVMPLARLSLEFAQREYNGMLIGIYDLLKEIREQIEAGKDYIETLRDFWIAEAELIAALGGALPQPAASKGDVRS